MWTPEQCQTQQENLGQQVYSPSLTFVFLLLPETAVYFLMIWLLLNLDCTHASIVTSM